MTTTHKETGGPAFPVPTGCGEEQGMTLRDYFAAKAMQGMCASFSNVAKNSTPDFLRLVPTLAYDIADAMLKERNKR